MSLATTQGSILLNTMRKADLEWRLLCITDSLREMSCQATRVQEDMLNEVQSMYSYQAILTSENNKDEAEKIVALNSLEFYTAYQQQMAQINAKEKVLEQEKLQIENQLKAINTLDEGYQKQLENNLKKSVLNV